MFGGSQSSIQKKTEYLSNEFGLHVIVLIWKNVPCRRKKGHFKVGLSTVDPNFPIREWDRLINQAEITLNLLRISRANPKLSAYAYLFGQFDYNKTPIIPPGTQVLVHDKADKRSTLALNGEQGWTIGTSPEYYCCLKYFPLKLEASMMQIRCPPPTKYHFQK